jgi:hypothetical protein
MTECPAYDEWKLNETDGGIAQDVTELGGIWRLLALRRALVGILGVILAAICDS